MDNIIFFILRQNYTNYYPLYINMYPYKSHGIYIFVKLKLLTF